jgi:hypothetical protein
MSELGFGNISFPVFRVGVKEPQHDGGVSFYLLGSDTTESTAEYKLLVIDDKNRPEPSLPLRRLALKAAGVELYSLTKTIFFIGDLVKLAKSNTWFVDREGQFFQYKKSQRVPLVFRKIKRITRLPSGGALVEVEGFAQRFKTLFMPGPEQTYAGLLLIQKSVVLYGLYDQAYDDTIRAV